MSDLEISENLRRQLEALNNEAEPVAGIISQRRKLKDDLIFKLTFCASAPLGIALVIVEQISIYAELQLTVRYR